MWVFPSALCEPGSRQATSSSSLTIPIILTSPSHVHFLCGNRRGDGLGWEKGWISEKGSLKVFYAREILHLGKEGEGRS